MSGDIYAGLYIFDISKYEEKTIFETKIKASVKV